MSERRPHLTVVHADDTFGSLESRSTWDEWSEDYDYDEAGRPATAVTNRYAKAYSSRPNEVVASQRYEAPIRRRTMKSQRRMMFTRLVLAAAVLTLAALFTGSSLLFDVAALSLLAVVAFVALAFYSVSQGYLHDSSLPIRVPQRRPLATIEPLYGRDSERFASHDEAEFESEFYEPEADYQWDRQPQRRRALG